MPFSNDQFAWAHRAYDMGVGSYPIYKNQLSAPKLREAMDYALSSPVAEQAKVLGEHIAAEDGAAECAKVIVNLLG